MPVKANNGESMRIIISPAKKMKTDTEDWLCNSMPQFLAETKVLLHALKRLDYAALKRLWHCNDTIAALNYERVQKMNLRKNLTPAILSYEGIQYQYMAPGIFEDEQFSYLNDHLYILSGFYGLLRPFDGVTPYRLEMQAKLNVNGCKDLYDFWGDTLAQQLCSETDFILNLASNEYSRVISPHLPKTVRLLTCTFGEWKEGRVIEKGTLCKMARGEMVRWLAERSITAPDEMKRFDYLGYTYSEALSTKNNFVFIS